MGDSIRTAFFEMLGVVSIDEWIYVFGKKKKEGVQVDKPLHPRIPIDSCRTIVTDFIAMAGMRGRHKIEVVIVRRGLIIVCRLPGSI